MFYNQSYKLGWQDGYWYGIPDCPYDYESYAYLEYWNGFYDGEDDYEYGSYYDY